MMRNRASEEMLGSNFRAFGQKRSQGADTTMGGGVASGYVAYVTDYKHLADLAACRESPYSENLAGLS